MTEQEQQAIDKLAEKFSIHKDSEVDAEEGFLAGAKALDEMRKPNFDNRAKIQELLWAFSCDGTTDPNVITEEIILLAQNCKPSENIKQAIEDAAAKYAGISDDKFANSAKTYDAYNIDESFKNGAEFALKLSENSGQVDDKTLIEMIINVIYDNTIPFSGCDEGRIIKSYEKLKFISTEITKLIPSKSQENDLNAELLEAAKKLIELHICEMEGLSSGQPTLIEWMNAVDKLSEAITKYENQSK